MLYRNILQIDQGGKAIPYGGTGVIRDDGDANYGFMNLKGSLARIAEIPELERDEALRDLVLALNQPQSAFATVGCVSGRVDEEEGHRVSGYVEFAFDSRQGIADAANYFPVFFHFDRALHAAKFSDRVSFHWELMGATFITMGERGYTVAVTVNTDWYPSADEATAAWRNGLDFLSDHFTHFMPSEDRFFSDAMNIGR